MEIRNHVIVLTLEQDPQFAMLKDVPHTICTDPANCDTNDATVIFNWSGKKKLLKPVLEMSPHVRWIHSRSAGLDELIFPELAESNIVLTNGTGVFSQSLGEFALGAILYFAKDFRRMLRQQAAGRWEQFDVEEIAGQTVGIVGYGDIGRAVAARVKAMGMKVLANRRNIPATSDRLIDRYYRPQELHEMLALCDFVVVTAPLTEETRHMLSDAEFAAMKSNAVVINVGRGPIIDEAAILKALTTKRIKGAGLDVFEHEPLPPGHAFYKLENVLLSPHCADHTAEWMNDAMRFFLKQLAKFEKGEPLENIVDKRRGY
jgi:phosphoglycerate dehydrogenase-like enzyme